MSVERFTQNTLLTKNECEGIPLSSGACYVPRAEVMNLGRSTWTCIVRPVHETRLWIYPAG